MVPQVGSRRHRTRSDRHHRRAEGAGPGRRPGHPAPREAGNHARATVQLYGRKLRWFKEI